MTRIHPRRGTASRTRRLLLLAALALTATTAAGCGSTASSTPSPTATHAAAANPPPGPDLTAAETPRATLFPQPHGRTIEALAQAATGGQLSFGAATGTFTPGLNRIAFALTTSAGAFTLAPTALYIARSLTAPALGPFLAPADPMGVAPQYRSRQNAGPGGISAIYEAELPLPQPGLWDVLALTSVGERLLRSPTQVAVARSSPVPAVGANAPAVATDTLTSTHGDLHLVTTRIPPEQMHAASLAQVLGRRPVALLFSTPEFCTSRVCGPVTDELVQLQHSFAGRLEFIHSETLQDNNPRKGLRAAMRAFHLQTEPWLFTIDAHGRIAARLEGTFGLRSATAALEAALR